MTNQALDRRPRVTSVGVGVGHETLEHGRVEALLNSNGWLSVTKSFEGKSDSFETAVGDETVDEVMRRADDLSRVRFDEDRGYTPVPDEARYRIDLVFVDEDEMLIEVWQNELESKDEAWRLVRLLGEQVREVSDGRAIL